MTPLRRAFVGLIFFLLGFLAVGVPAGLGGMDDLPNPHGRPKAFKAGKFAVYGIWFDDGAWNLRVSTAKGKRDVFTGTVRAEKGKLIGKFDGLEKGDVEDADWVFPHRDGTGFDFRFVNVGKIDGVTFKASDDATALAFDLRIDGTAHPERVFVGKKGAHPSKIPFTLPAHPAK